MSDLIQPSGAGSADPTTKKLVGGWQNMQKGKQLTRQERLIKEQEEKAQRIKNGQPLNEEGGYKPGQDESSEQFSMKRAKEFLTKMNEQKRAQKIFKGNAEQCMLKMASLMGSLAEDGRKFEKGKVMMVEQAGFGQYKLTYMPD